MYYRWRYNPYIFWTKLMNANLVITWLLFCSAFVTMLIAGIFSLKPLGTAGEVSFELTTYLATLAILTATTAFLHGQFMDRYADYDWLAALFALLSSGLTGLIGLALLGPAAVIGCGVALLAYALPVLADMGQ